MSDNPIALPVALEPQHAAHLANSCGSRSRNERNPSFQGGKDEPQQVAAVRGAWLEYQTKEKQFSETFALALIALNKEFAKPGSGSFVENLKKLKIPRMTAYRLMRLHGWKAEKRKKEKPIAMPEEEIYRIARGQAITNAVGYLGRFEGEALRDKCEQFCEKFCEELRRELFPEVA